MGNQSNQWEKKKVRGSLEEKYVMEGTIRIDEELYDEIMRRLDGEDPKRIDLNKFLQNCAWIWIKQYPWQPGEEKEEKERKPRRVMDGTLGRIVLS